MATKKPAAKKAVPVRKSAKAFASRGSMDNIAKNISAEIVAQRVADALPTTKAVNPKEGIGLNKLPLHLWPASATAMGCLGILEGREKYGRSNFRATDVLATVYIDACKRHLDAYLEGEDLSPEGVPHMANALACLAILVDAKAAGTLVDDRNIEGGYRSLVNELTPFVSQIVGAHADKDPKHYTIKDNQQ
jgi:hypothetical protein